MDRFEGRVAVVTGAASGFGRAFALHAARLRMQLVLADVDVNGLEATAVRCRESAVTVVVQPTDVASDASVAELARRAGETFPAVHLLFNNAGVGGGGLIWENTEADWQWVLGVNLMGIAHGIRHFVPRMLAQEAAGQPAHVVNTASIAGWLTPPLMGVYNVSKHAAVALSETLHHDLRVAGSRIGVSCLCPGFVPTGIAHSHRNRPVHLANAQPPTASMRTAQAASEKAVASGRLTAEQVAEQTFEAIRANRFYVFTHPQMLPAVRARFEHALAGEAPADPFAGKPELRPGLG